MIREAHRADIHRLVEMGRRFFDVSGYPQFAEFDAESLRQTLQKIMSGNEGTVLVVDQNNRAMAMVAVILFPFYFNRNHISSTELFWWCEPEDTGIGLRLFRAGEAWARDHGAKTMHMGVLETLRPDELGALYERAGYRAHERAYLKRF